jgi:hypothetical protein
MWRTKFLYADVFFSLAHNTSMKGKTIKSQNIRRYNFINPSSSRLHKKYTYCSKETAAERSIFTRQITNLLAEERKQQLQNSSRAHTHVPRPDLQKEHACKRKPDIKRARIIDPKKRVNLKTSQETHSMGKRTPKREEQERSTSNQGMHIE